MTAKNLRILWGSLNDIGRYEEAKSLALAIEKRQHRKMAKHLEGEYVFHRDSSVTMKINGYTYEMNKEAVYVNARRALKAMLHRNHKEALTRIGI